MSAATLPRRRAERFAQLLDEANGGRRHHVRSRADAELAELVTLGHRVTAATPVVEVDPEFRAGLRAMLVATAERDAIGGTLPTGSDQRPRARVVRAAPDRHPADRPTKLAAGRGFPSNRSLPPNRGRTRGAIIVGVAVGAIAVSGMSAASENAMPGDALYGVKRSTERAQLALASSDVTRGQLYLDFAHKRAAEARTTHDDLASALAEMDADTRQGTRLLTTAAVQRRDPAALDALRNFVRDQREHVGELIGFTNGTDRERALKSLRLLDEVDNRAVLLHDLLPCGPSGTARSDSLGPRPGHCEAAPPDPTATRTDADTAAAQRTAGVDKSHEPGATGTGAPSDPPAATDAIGPAQPADDGGGGLLRAIGRILNGLLD